MVFSKYIKIFHFRIFFAFKLTKLKGKVLSRDQRFDLWLTNFRRKQQAFGRFYF
jgi:hypothetical protein